MVCPHSPPIPWCPKILFPSTIIPPPTPVPIITPKTTLGFFIISLTDPKCVSAKAKQLASFSIFTFIFKIFSRSFLIGL
tara:strand:- start:935 stop:1171 length:237 start_codon:yes stop_codon:yes gene_type:complete